MGRTRFQVRSQSFVSLQGYHMSRGQPRVWSTATTSVAACPATPTRLLGKHTADDAGHDQDPAWNQVRASLQRAPTLSCLRRFSLSLFATQYLFVFRLQTFVTKVQSAVNGQSWHASTAQSAVSPTLAAFAATLASHMRPMWAELVHIEEDLQRVETGSLPPQHTTSLLKLEYQLQVCLLSCAHVLEP